MITKLKKKQRDMSVKYVNIGTVSGQLDSAILSVPTQTYHVTDKAYVDAAAATASSTVVITNSQLPATVSPTVGITLPTAGGTPSVLDFYEHLDVTETWTGPGMWSQAVTIHMVRTGINVNISINGPELQVNGPGLSARITSSVGVIPARFRPMKTECCSLPVSDASDVVQGLATLSPAGTILVGAYPSGVSIALASEMIDPAAFILIGRAGFAGFHFSYNFA